MEIDQPIPPREVEVHGRRYQIAGPASILILEDGLLGITPDNPMRINPGSGTHYRVMKELAGAGALGSPYGDDAIFDDIRELVHEATAPPFSIWSPSTWAWDTIGWWAMGAGAVGGLGYAAWRYQDDIKGLMARENPHQDRLPGGLADKRTPGDFDAGQIQKGIAVEREHTTDKRLAREIAMDHLAEIPDYYTRLAAMEAEAEVRRGPT